jgi:hypothetical protein
MPLDLNVVVNHFNSLPIFVQDQSTESILVQFEKEVSRMRAEYPQCKTEPIFIKEVAPIRLGPPKIAMTPDFFHTWVLEVRLYGVRKTIWYISGDPCQAYSAMYPHFFRQPSSVILDDLSATSQSNQSIAVWEKYVDQSNNNEHWMNPQRVEHRSHQLIY